MHFTLIISISSQSLAHFLTLLTHTRPASIVNVAESTLMLQEWEENFPSCSNFLSCSNVAGVGREFHSSCIANKSSSYTSGIVPLIITAAKRKVTYIRIWQQLLALVETNVRKICTEIYNLGMLIPYLIFFNPHVF